MYKKERTWGLVLSTVSGLYWGSWNVFLLDDRQRVYVQLPFFKGGEVGINLYLRIFPFLLERRWVTHSLGQMVKQKMERTLVSYHKSDTRTLVCLYLDFFFFSVRKAQTKLKLLSYSSYGYLALYYSLWNSTLNKQTPKEFFKVVIWKYVKVEMRQ